MNYYLTVFNKVSAISFQGIKNIDCTYYTNTFFAIIKSINNICSLLRVKSNSNIFSSIAPKPINVRWIRTSFEPY